MTDTLQLKVPGKAEYLRYIRGWCESLMKERGFENAPIQEFLLALTEACANTIEHCLGMDPKKHLHLECRLGRSKFQVAASGIGDRSDRRNIGRGDIRAQW